MRTAIIIGAGVVLLGVCILIARWTGATASAAFARAALHFLPAWFIAAAVNMWMGMARAGYPVAEEAPIFAVIFAVPAALALLIWWKYSRG